MGVIASPHAFVCTDRYVALCTGFRCGCWLRSHGMIHRSQRAQDGMLRSGRLLLHDRVRAHARARSLRGVRRSMQLEPSVCPYMHSLDKSLLHDLRAFAT